VAPVLALLACAPAAHGGAMRWDGTLALDPLGPGLPTLSLAGTGVATLNGSAGGSHLTALRLAGGLSRSATVPVTDPGITGAEGIAALRARATLGTATLAPFASGAPLTRGELPVRGLLAVCFVDPACLPGGFLPLALTANDGATGLGVGGLHTVQAGAVRISILASPWTLGTALLTLTTNGGSSAPLGAAGWAHGALSFTTSTALTGGALSLVTPLRIVSDTGPPLSSFARLTLRFVPEPGSAVLLGSGALGLACLALARRSS
jgi:hypothetical protein